MFERFDRALGAVVMALAYMACAIVTTIFVMIVIDVSIRTMGFTPPSFTLSVVEYALLYFAMFSAPYLVRTRGHVVIEALVSVLPAPVRTALAYFVYIGSMSVSLLFAYYSFQLEFEAIVLGNVDVRGIDMPYWLMFLPMGPCFILVALEFLRYLIGPYSYYTYDLSNVRDDV